jgi:hypothetical protein
MLKIMAAFILSGGVALLAAAGEYPSIQQYQNIPYVSGGVGDEEQQALETMVARFNLKLIFARSSGEYLADIQVRILDHQGNTVLQANSGGPWFYTSLPPGIYTVQASSAGKTLEQKIAVSSDKLREVGFRWQ